MATLYWQVSTIHLQIHQVIINLDTQYMCVLFYVWWKLYILYKDDWNKNQFLETSQVSESEGHYTCTDGTNTPEGASK